MDKKPRKSRFADRVGRNQAKLSKKMAKVESKFKKNESEIEQLLAKSEDEDAEELLEQETAQSTETEDNNRSTAETETTEAKTTSTDKVEKPPAEDSGEHAKKSAKPDESTGSDGEIKDSAATKEGQQISDSSKGENDSAGETTAGETNSTTKDAAIPAAVPDNAVADKKGKKSMQSGKPLAASGKATKSDGKSGKKERSPGLEKSTSKEQTASAKTADKTVSSAANVKKPASSKFAAGALGGGFGARGGKKVEASELIKKVITRLRDDEQLRTISRYHREFRQLLTATTNHSANVAFVGNSKSREDKTVDADAGRWYVDTANQEFWNSSEELSGLGLGPGIGQVWIASWAQVDRLTPVQLGVVHREVDLFIIDSLPQTTNELDRLELLQRVCASGALVLLDAELQESVDELTKRYKHCFGYSLLDDDYLMYAEINQPGARQYLAAYNADNRAKLIEFSIHKRITQLARNLQAQCQWEINRQRLGDTIKGGLKGGVDQKSQLAKIEFLMKSTIAESKAILSSKGMSLDEFGIPQVDGEPAEMEIAQGLLSEFSIRHLIREEELDVLKFSEEERKYLNRFKRFKFASKFSYLWKLSPDYILQLHSSLAQIIEERVLLRYRQVTAKVEENLEQIASLLGAMNNRIYANRFSEFKRTWKSDQHLLDLIRQRFDISDFRAFVFAKRGNAAPIEAQSGVMKELKESRMFVSQLMAFGMLGAMLFGSVYAVDVFSNWVSGESLEIGSELTEAAKDSRALGRQVRIMIAGVAGVGIVFYLLLRMYLKKPEELLEKQRILDSYSDHLEGVVSSYLSNSSEFAKEVISSDLEMLNIEYEEFKSAITESSSEQQESDDGKFGKGMTLNANVQLKKFEDLHKWLTGILSERESLSIVQAHKAALTDAKKEIGD